MLLPRARTITFAFALAALLAAAPSAQRPPNVVYILRDQHRADMIGCAGDPVVRTPNMDRLAGFGMRFTQHYAGSTVCAPTRSCLMTGQHTGHTPIRGNGNAADQPERVLPIGAGTTTVASLLQQRGYATGAFGKWGLGGPGSDSDALRLGFDHFTGFYSQAFAHDYYPRWLWRDGEKLELDRERYAHDVYMDDALRFVRRHKDGPFFCYLPVIIPHAAMQAPPEYHRRFRERYPQFDDKVGRYRGDGRTTEVQNPIAGFAAMMTRLDDDVGRLLQLLDELGIADDTLVILSSDNGPHHEGGHDPAFWDSNGPFTGTKRSLYDGGIRVPLLARWPGRIEAGTTSELISAHWDLLPTLCELAGAEVPAGIDGLSMLPTLLGRDGQRRHDYLYWEFYEAGGKQALRFGRWKAVRNGLHQDADAPIELYEITADPAEQRDVADEHPEVVARARRWLAEAHTPASRWRFRGRPRDGKR
ncbi:MAG: arylsulfatase [Planctomycetes bacterium]|nr:arylsulfatase [Planctomycetota bacterium]